MGSAGAFAGALAPAATALRPQDVFVLAFSGYARAGGGGPPAAVAAWTNATQCASPQPDAAKRDCGFSGITAAQCAARACCWTAAAPPPGVPQCFAGAPVPPTRVAFAAPAGAAPDACWDAVDVLGAPLAPVCAAGGVVELMLDDGPQYLL